jgi:hypothetical protein
LLALHRTATDLNSDSSNYGGKTEKKKRVSLEARWPPVKIHGVQYRIISSLETATAELVLVCT